MKRILGFTGSRAELFIQLPIFLEFSKSAEFSLDVIVCSADSDTQILIKDTLLTNGISIVHYIDLSNISSLHSFRISHVLQSVLQLSLDNYDLGLVYADRYESFGFALALSQSFVPLAHFEAGDHTCGGTFDDVVRHSISMLSSVFITTNSAASNHLNSFLFDPSRIFQAGTFNVPKIIEPVPIEELYPNLNDFDALVLLTYHPLSSNQEKQKIELHNLIEALHILDRQYKLRLFITGVNQDFGSDIVSQSFKRLSLSNAFISYHTTLGLPQYLSFMQLGSKYRVILMGNSSSLVKESPFFPCSSLLIGDRQRGRLLSSNTLLSSALSSDIVSKFADLLSTYSYTTPRTNPYFHPSPIASSIDFIHTFLRSQSSNLLNPYTPFL